MSRVLLSKEIQSRLVFSSKEKLGCNWRQLAVFLGVSKRSLENWSRGTRLLPEEVFLELIKISKIVIKNPTLLPDNWGCIKGGENCIKLHGRSFWTLEGSIKGGINSSRKFPLPDYSEELAEFIGIMLGDGGITRGQISITLGYTTDHKYVPYIRKLIKKLFATGISTYRPRERDVIRIKVSGVNLVRNLCSLGLVCGNKTKQQIDIPFWILNKESYMKACIRGLIDTDGCVHRKTRREKNGDEYRSIGITFKTASVPLQRSLIGIFNELGFKVAVSGRDLYFCGKEQIERYVEEIGFSNPKHLQRYQNFLFGYGWKKVNTKNCLPEVI